MSTPSCHSILVQKILLQSVRTWLHVTTCLWKLLPVFIRLGFLGRVCFVSLVDAKASRDVLPAESDLSVRPRMNCFFSSFCHDAVHMAARHTSSVRQLVLTLLSDHTVLSLPHRLHTVRASAAISVILVLSLQAPCLERPAKQQKVSKTMHVWSPMVQAGFTRGEDSIRSLLCACRGTLSNVSSILLQRVAINILRIPKTFVVCARVTFFATWRSTTMMLPGVLKRCSSNGAGASSTWSVLLAAASYRSF